MVLIWIHFYEVYGSGGGYWLVNFKMGWKDRELGFSISNVSICRSCFLGCSVPSRRTLWFPAWEDINLVLWNLGVQWGQEATGKQFIKSELVPFFLVQYLNPTISCVNLYRKSSHLSSAGNEGEQLLDYVGQRRGQRVDSVISSLYKHFPNPRFLSSFRGTQCLHILFFSALWYRCDLASCWLLLTGPLAKPSFQHSLVCEVSSKILVDSSHLLLSLVLFFFFYN